MEKEIDPSDIGKYPDVIRGKVHLINYLFVQINKIYLYFKQSIIQFIVLNLYFSIKKKQLFYLQTDSCSS